MEIPARITHSPLSHTHCTTLHGDWIFPPFSTPSPIRAHDNTVACVVHSSCNNLSIPCHHNRHTRYPSHVWILWPAPVWPNKITHKWLFRMRSTNCWYRNSSHLLWIFGLRPHSPESFYSAVKWDSISRRTYPIRTDKYIPSYPSSNWGSYLTTMTRRT